MTRIRRNASANSFYVLLAGVAGLLVVLGVMLYNLGRGTSPSAGPQSAGQQSASDGPPLQLVLYCAAGIRPPVEKVVADYRNEYGVPVQLQYGGTNTLLSQIEVANTGDLFLAADDSYIQLAQSRGLVQEALPIAVMRPVIAVHRDNPKNIQSIQDLLRDDVRTALGNPDQAAIGRATRKLLQASGEWSQLERQVTRRGVFKPTVPEVANDVKLGSADASIVWDTTVAQYPELQAVRVPQLDAGTAHVTVGILTSSATPTRALHFARYLTARDKGQQRFTEAGFETVPGDAWADAPEITFFCGSVNRRAVESIIAAFEQREGVTVNTIYNGCGILTAQMQTIRDQEQQAGFPDTYMACDRYYLDTVQQWFQDDVDVSDTRLVIAVPKGNPANIQHLADLAKPGVRISVGQPDQCTVGVLTRQLLKSEGIYDEVMRNVVTETATSAMLVPTVTTGSVDASLAYATDTLAEADKVDAIPIDSAAAEAIQPFAIARSSDHKFLGRRLFDAIARSQDSFETAGFHFRLTPKQSAAQQSTP